MKKYIEKQLCCLPGTISFYYKNLVSGEVVERDSSQSMKAASVIKLFVMTEAFAQMQNGDLDPNRLIPLKREDKVPPSGVLTFMHEGLQVTIMDLVILMIVLSDNTATNVLIDLLGMDKINQSIEQMGFKSTVLRRKMYDSQGISQGINNSISARDAGILLEGMYRGEVISPQASQRMIGILKDQQVNGKIPFYLSALAEEPEIAHKTGEDTGITHDVGIIYAKNPFVVCFCGNDTDTPLFERVMAEMALELYKHNC